MNRFISNILRLIVLMISIITHSSFAQQDPHYTQYMYNTMSVNPAYAGSTDYMELTALGRTQWVGIDGAPDSQSFSGHAPISRTNLGAGFNFMNDQIGPASEIYFDGNLSYGINFTEKSKLALGIRLGGRMLSLDWNKGSYEVSGDPNFENNVNYDFLPTIGAGLYYYSDKYYVGLSVPNFVQTDSYDALSASVAEERLHYFLMAGYVFDISEDLKFKPALISKAVKGAPLSFDVSANFLLHERVTLGVAYRYQDAISGLFGLQVSDNLFMGYAYDLTTSNYSNYNTGSHELMLKYRINTRKTKIKSPRFF